MSDAPNFFDPETPLRAAPLNLFPNPLPADLEERQERTRIAQEQCLATPGVLEFIRSVRYPQQAQCIPGREMNNGEHVTTLEQVKEWYYRVEPDLDKAFGYKPPGAAKTNDWAQRQELWSRQRAQREADKAAREAEREAKRQQRASLEADVDEARRLWKDAIRRKNDVIRECDAEIHELHEAFTERKRLLDQL